MQVPKSIRASLKRFGVSDGDWMVAFKAGFHLFMRPGWDWRVRVIACGVCQSHGFHRELAVWQVAGKVLLPLFPGGIVQILQQEAERAYAEAGVEPSEQQKARFVIDRGNMRRLLQNIEEEDGACVRAAINPNLVKADAKKTIRSIIDQVLPLHECLSKKLVVPVTDLSRAECRQISERSLLFFPAKPRPATAKALNRHVDEGILGLKVVNDDYLAKRASAVPALIEFRRQAQHLGLSKEDADKLAKHPEMVALFDEYREIGERRDQWRARLASKMKVLAEQGSLFDEAHNAKLWPNGTTPIAPAAISPADLGQIIDGLRAWLPRKQVDDGLAEGILRDCREREPQCTLVAILVAIQAVGPHARKATNPAAYMRATVRLKFGGESARRPSPEAAAGPDSRAEFLERRKQWAAR